MFCLRSRSYYVQPWSSFRPDSKSFVLVAIFLIKVVVLIRNGSFVLMNKRLSVVKRDLMGVLRPTEIVWIGADNPVKKEEGGESRVCPSTTPST